MEVNGREMAMFLIIIALTISLFFIATDYEQRIENLIAIDNCTYDDGRYLFCAGMDKENNWLATVKDQNNLIQTANWINDFCEKTIGCEK